MMILYHIIPYKSNNNNDNNYIYIQRLWILLGYYYDTLIDTYIYAHYD